MVQSASPPHAVGRKVLPGLGVDVECFQVSLADILVAQLWAAFGSPSRCQLSIKNVLWDAAILQAVDMTQPTWPCWWKLIGVGYSSQRERKHAPTAVSERVNMPLQQSARGQTCPYSSQREGKHAPTAVSERANASVQQSARGQTYPYSSQREGKRTPIAVSVRANIPLQQSARGQTCSYSSQREGKHAPTAVSERTNMALLVDADWGRLQQPARGQACPY